MTSLADASGSGLKGNRDETDNSGQVVPNAIARRPGWPSAPSEPLLVEELDLTTIKVRLTPLPADGSCARC